MINFKSNQVYKKLKNNFDGELSWLSTTPDKISKINYSRVHNNKRSEIAFSI